MLTSPGPTAIAESFSTGWRISAWQDFFVLRLLGHRVLFPRLRSRRNVPRDEIVLAAMPLSAELRLTTPLRVAIHPQFEAAAGSSKINGILQ